MKNFLFVCVLLLIDFSAVAQAQIMDVVRFTGPSADPVPANVHDYAIKEIKDFYDYTSRNDKLDSNITERSIHVSTFVFGNGTKQSFSVDKDGKITLDNISLEDALLSMIAVQSSESLERMKGWDQQEEAREKAKKSVPPSPIRLGNERWILYNGPDWSQGKVLGDTTCGLKRIRILDVDPDKQGTVMHELMHVASGCAYGQTIHSLITEIAPKMVKLLRENPDLVKYLTEPSVKPAAPKKDEEKR